jgi:hypothetical protein
MSIRARARDVIRAIVIAALLIGAVIAIGSQRSPALKEPPLLGPIHASGQPVPPIAPVDPDFTGGLPGEAAWGVKPTPSSSNATAGPSAASSGVVAAPSE